MIRNLAAMTASQLKRDVRDEQKKSMLSRLSPEACKLFDLLAAQDWRDENPKMSKSMKDLVSDRDSQRALAVIKTQTKRWSGLVSEKGLLGFFANGFAAHEIQESPGGFTIFMFKPITALHKKDKKGRQQQVRLMFGSTELDEDAIKYYAENDFYLAETLEGLEEQIYTCIKCLEKFTERDGIATEGFEHGLRMLQDNKRIFHHLFRMDHLFPVKFAYLLDRVFQNFVDELGNFYNDEKPIRRAKRRLKMYQVNAIENAMAGYETSCAPRLFLPSSLQSEEPPDGPRTKPGPVENKPKTPKKEPEQRPSEPWWTSNPSIVATWQLPEGKTYNDFFNPREPEKKANTLGWPRFPHHKFSNKSKNLCLKYQTKGTCSSACFMAHVDPAKMDSTAKQLVEDRFKAVYSTT
jgi:hypothetical protein